MSETKTDKIEREYVIPLREKCRTVQRYRKSEKAVKVIKEFLAQHMKVRDRDLNKIRLDKYVNEYIWANGIKNPPHKVKVKAIKEGDIVRVELAEMSDHFKFKKQKEEKMHLRGAVKKTTKKAEEKPAEEKKEENEKKTAVVEAGEKESKEEHLKEKHTTETKPKRSQKAEEKGYDKQSRGK